MESSVAKTLIIIGVIFIVAGLIWHVTDGKIPLGRLPGDIRIESENAKFYFPITTSIILSILMSVILYFFRK